MNLGAATKQFASAISRDGEEQLRINEGRLARGIVRFSPPALAGPSFGERLLSLLPPEQTMPPVSRALASRAAESLARQGPISVLGVGDGLPSGIVVSDSTGAGAEAVAPSAPAAQAAIPTGVSSGAGRAGYLAVGALLGLAQRALGVAIDPGLATGLSFARDEPLSARPIRGEGSYRLRVARDAYLQYQALPAL